MLGPGRIELPAGGNAADHMVTAPYLYWGKVVITVADDGIFSYSGSNSISDAWTEAKSVANEENIYAGTYDITIDGAYDTEQKTFSGDFSTDYETVHDYKSVSTTAGLEFTGQGHHIVREGTFSGEVTGSLDLGGGTATLIFSGTDSWTESGTDDSGKPMKEQSGSSREIQTVDFPVQGEVAGQTFDENTAPDISTAGAAGGNSGNDEVTISRIYGDVIISDPAMTGAQLAWPQKYWRALRILTGRVDDVDQPWRVWVDPEKGMRLTDGYRMKTGNGRAVVQFRDGTKFVIREGSTVTFSNGGIVMDTGNFTYSFVKQGRKIYLQDRRSNWSIIGTTFDISTDDVGTTLKVYEGTVETESRATGEKVQVDSGGEIFISDTGLGDITPISGAASIDIDGLEREIIDAEMSDARTQGMIVLGGTALMLAAIVVAAALILRRRKSKGAAAG